MQGQVDFWHIVINYKKRQMVAHEAKPSPGQDEGDPDKPDRWIKHKMLQETQQLALVQKQHRWFE